MILSPIAHAKEWLVCRGPLVMKWISFCILPHLHWSCHISRTSSFKSLIYYIGQKENACSVWLVQVCLFDIFSLQQRGGPSIYFWDYGFVVKPRDEHASNVGRLDWSHDWVLYMGTWGLINANTNLNPIVSQGLDLLPALLCVRSYISLRQPAYLII